MGGISLTASMRSNLLSLQNISGQVSSTQNKLATGNKVNSAIDNPSSYYTALSLNNRADDLNALLDSMGQAVSTIKAATTALESATEFLEQAKAVANQALESAKVPDKAFFEEKVGENGAVVTTAQELYSAIEANKETICIYGHIDLGNIDDSNKAISLKENQKLVGVGYFGNYDSEVDKFSSISATTTTANDKNMINITKNNCLVSDLGISYSTKNNIGIRAIGISGLNTSAYLHNLDLNVAGTDSGGWKMAIFSSSVDSPSVTISGDININVLGNSAKGIALQGTCNIDNGSKVNIVSEGVGGLGIFVATNTAMNIGHDVKINIQSAGAGCGGIEWTTTEEMNLKSGTVINIESENVGINLSNSQCNMDGAIINIETQKGSAFGIYNSILNIGKATSPATNSKSDTIINIKSEHIGMSISNSTCNIDNAKINVEAVVGSAIDIGNSSTFNINKEALLALSSSGTGASTLDIESNSICNINQGAQVSIVEQGDSWPLYIIGGGTCNVMGNLFIEGTKTGNVYVAQHANNQLNILSSAQVYLNTGTKDLFYNGLSDGTSFNTLNIAQGAKIAVEQDGQADWYEVKKDWKDENKSTTTTNKITIDNINDKLSLESTSAWDLPEKVEIDFEDSNSSDETAKQDLADAGKNYQEIINQYDSLIKDAGYKGINLLQPEKLTVKFNEDNTAALEVQGKDMSSKALGFTIFEWQTQGDINASIEELTSAINSIRNYSSELGNNYNIITTRQDFTESLVNVLTEGADKLTLADMNEESANMLALQTRQQLAINSLSLASQASQSILKLF